MSHFCASGRCRLYVLNPTYQNVRVRRHSHTRRLNENPQDSEMSMDGPNAEVSILHVSWKEYLRKCLRGLHFTCALCLSFWHCRVSHYRCTIARACQVALWECFESIRTSLLQEKTTKRDIGRPIIYHGDPLSPDVTLEQRRLISRRIVNRESARRVRGRRHEVLDRLAQKVSNTVFVDNEHIDAAVACDNRAMDSVPVGRSLTLLKQQDFHPSRLTTWNRPMLYYAKSSKKFRAMEQSWKSIWNN